MKLSKCQNSPCKRNLFIICPEDKDTAPASFAPSKKKDQSQPGTPGGEPKDDFFWTSANDLPWNSDSNRILEAIIRVASNFPLDNPISDYFCSKTNPHLGTVFQITCKSYKDPTCVFQIPDILYQIIHEGWDPSLIQTLMVAGAQLPTQYMKLMEIIDSSLRNQFFNLFQICLSKLEEVPYSLLSKVITITGNLDLVQQLVEMGMSSFHSFPKKLVFFR
jgi:hypothetical protein